jgi:multidrug efflux pump
VARVERGVEDDSMIVRVNGQQAVGLGVLRQSLSNTVAVSNAVRERIEEIRPTCPKAWRSPSGPTRRCSWPPRSREVLKALLLSLGLVVLVILVFLRSITAT